MKKITVYKIVGENMAPMTSREKFAAFAEKIGRDTSRIVPVEIMVAEDGDHVTAEIHRGSVSDDDGISSGGEWQVVEGVFRCYSTESSMIPDGAVYDLNGKHVQTMSSEIGGRGYPGRNLRVLGVES